MYGWHSDKQQDDVGDDVPEYEYWCNSWQHAECFKRGNGNGSIEPSKLGCTYKIKIDESAGRS